jgi:hypothetical protein
MSENSKQNTVILGPELPKNMFAQMKPVGMIRAKLISLSGRSWWEAQYSNGKTVAEWDTLQSSILTPLGDSSSSRWEEISKQNLVALRLLCPNGQAGELRTTGSFCLFQLKSGVFSLEGKGITSMQTCHYHIIGVILDTNGKCECRAWDYRNKKMLRFFDNITNMAFDNIGALHLGEAVGVK